MSAVSKTKLRTVGDILNTPRQQGPLQHLLQRLSEAKSLTELVRTALPEELMPVCYVCCVENNRLSLECESAAWASQVRYYIPKILKALQQNPDYQQIKAIDCRVKV